MKRKKYLQIVIDSPYSVQLARIVRNAAPQDLHIFMMIEGLGCSDVSPSFNLLRRYVYAAQISEVDLYHRITSNWLRQFDKIFWHNLTHIGVAAFIIEKLDEDILDKSCYVVWGTEIELDSTFAILARSSDGTVRVLQSHEMNHHSQTSLNIITTIPAKLTMIREPHFSAVSRFRHYIAYETYKHRMTQLGISGNFMCRAPIFPAISLPEGQESVEARIHEKFRRGLEARKTITIMVGHSCSPQDNHAKILRDLESFSHEDIFLVLPMSYNLNIPYRESIIEILNASFPGKAHVITEFMDGPSYANLLTELNIDIVIYNQSTLSGLGTLALLMLYGAKAIMNRSNPYLLQLRSEANCVAFDYEAVMQSEDALKPMSLEDTLSNSRSLRRYLYDESELVKNWEYFLTS